MTENVQAGKVALISEKEAMLIIETRLPTGLFLLPESDGSFTTIDNETGKAWTENFPNRETATAWLEGDFD
jgi:hypothetical protein